MHKDIGPEPLVLNADTIRSLANRMEQHAAAVSKLQPTFADDLRSMSRLARHVLRVGWVSKGSIAVQ